MKKVVLSLNSPAGRRWKLRGKRRAARNGIVFTRIGSSYISDWLSDEIADAQEGLGVSFVTKAIVEPEIVPEEAPNPEGGSDETSNLKPDNASEPETDAENPSESPIAPEDVPNPKVVGAKRLRRGLKSK